MAKSKSNKKNPILWFLLAFIVPLIIAIVLTVVVLSVAGVNVVDWAKSKGSNIPVVSTFIKTDEQEGMEEKIGRANETIEKQKEHIDTLNEDVSSLESIIENLETDVEKLEAKNKNQLSNKGYNDEEIDTIKQAASSFRKMEAEKAADIIVNMNDSLAVSILKGLSGEIRGDILAEMEPKKAAQLTSKMAAN